MTDTPPVRLTFTIAGFSKCGTTTLSSALGQHPDVLLPTVKEPWFFSWDDYADNWSSYQEQFPDQSRYSAIGDDSTTYTAHQFARQTAERLHRHYPDLRVLIIARDPVDRIESAFRESHHSSHRYGVLTPFALSDALADRYEVDGRRFVQVTTFSKHQRPHAAGRERWPRSPRCS